MADFGRRFGTLALAGVFIFTSLAFTAILFWESRNGDADPSANPDIQQQLQEQLQAQADEAGSCDIRTPVPASPESVPEAFKPEGDVTELQATDLEEGAGQEAKAGDCLVVKYHGTLAADGEKFDGNYDQETALQFPVGTGTVISGWDQGMIGVKVGGTRRLVIPSDLGYGETGSGSIPANADLVFVVKLIEIKEQ